MERSNLENDGALDGKTDAGDSPAEVTTGPDTDLMARLREAARIYLTGAIRAVRAEKT